MKRAMEVMVWFYENFDNFSPLIQDEDGDDNDGEKDDSDGVESKHMEELKDKRPRCSQELSIIEDELFPREDEPPAVQKESSPFFTDWRPASFTGERRPPKKEHVFFEEAEFFSKERPAVRREQLAFKEGRPTIKEERSALENLASVSQEERSILKEKRRIIRKARSPSKTGRSTIKEEPSTLEKEGPTQLEAILEPFHFTGLVEPIPPEAPDLLLPEEIVGAAQVKHLFPTNSRLNK